MQIKFMVVAGPHRGKEFVFSEHDSFVVGRGPQAHFRLARLDQYFSRLHFMVEVNPPRCRIVDLNSRNGILVNDATVLAADLNHGDIVQAGKTQLLVQIDSDVWALDDSAKADSSSDQNPRAGSCDEPAILPAVSMDRVIETLEERCVPVVPGKAVSRHSSPLLPDDDAEQIRQPQIVPGYQIVRELGRGGMGVVYQALRQSDNSLVALKTILPAVVASSKQKERFLREARILETLQHPGIVTFREMGECGGLLYFAMDYVPGTDAARLLRDNNGPLPIGRAVRITCQMLEALGYAHERGFVHRDIKPANLLIDNTSAGVDRVRLADFGLARVYQTSQISGLTMTGDIGGTPQFMPPEQILNFRMVQPASDQYAAAATLYYLLTSCPIYDFLPSAGAQLVMILQNEPVPIEQRRDDLPSGLAAILHRALKRNVADRFASVREFREALCPFAR